MISIARFMRGNGSAEPGSAELDSKCEAGSPVASLCACVLEYVGIYVFSGEFSRFRPQLEETKHVLAAEIGETEAARVAESVRAMLSEYSQTAQETLQKSAIEMQQMVGVLGNALAVLSGGSERSVSRLQRIQDTLRRTSTIQDVSALKASLRDVVQFIGEESSREQRALLGEKAGLETHVVHFRELLAGNPNRKLKGRGEGIRAISDSLAAPAPGKTVCVMAYVFDRLTAIVNRYGPDAVDDLFLQLIRERLQPVAPANTAFRWSPSGIVGIARMAPDLDGLKAEMARLNRAPLVCQIALGGRTAVLKVGLSHLVMEAREPSLDQMIGEIDRFTRLVNAGAE
jgi:hypothetical protein